MNAKRILDNEEFETEVLTALTKKLRNGIRSWKSNQANEVAATIVYDHGDVIEKYRDELTAEEIADKLIWFERDYLDKSKEPRWSRNESSQLKEAISTLQNAGLIVEDTETDDDEYWDEYNNERNKRRSVNKRIFDNQYHFDSYGYNRKSRRMDAKLMIGRLTNLAPLLKDAGIKVGELQAALDDGGRGEDIKLPIRVKGNYKGDHPNTVQCIGSRRLKDFIYAICDDDAILKELDTPEEVVEFLKGLN